LTAERFTPDPEGNGNRLYRTGDLALLNRDGHIEFVGRTDDQVKVRGFRIELGEIEKSIARYPGIAQAVVTAIGSGPYGKELAAWFTSTVEIDVDALWRHLAAELPEYMIPADLMQIQQLPLSKTGKVDRRALPTPRRAAAKAGLAPDGDTEKRMIAIWERILERPVPGADSNFFECGGHSLKVPSLVSVIREEFKMDLPFAAVFRQPTVRGLCELLIAQAQFGTAASDEAMVLLNNAAAPLRLFAFPPGRSDALGYGGLARALDGVAAFWSFNFIPRETRLAEYAECILAEQVDGLYLLFGYSGGGRLAYQVAAELERRGKQVALVLMADSSRYLARIPVSPDQVERQTLELVDSDAVKPSLTTGVLRDKAIRRIRAYYDYIYNTVDSWIINADIHLVVCENAVTTFVDEQGRLLASNAAWKDATRGRLVTHQGSGSHNDMFNEPAMEANAALLKGILALGY
jgi:thioesterase domain-containing protein